VRTKTGQREYEILYAKDFLLGVGNSIGTPTLTTVRRIKEKTFCPEPLRSCLAASSDEGGKSQVYLRSCKSADRDAFAVHVLILN
jgi:hypothetical protein